MSRLNRSGAAIARLASELTTSYEPEILLHDVCDQALACLDARLATVVVVHEDEILLLASSTAGELADEPNALHATGPSAEAARLGGMSLLDDVRSGQGRWPDTADAMSPLGLVGVRSFPMRLDRQPVGSLTLYTGDAWGLERSSQIGQTLANLAVLALSTDQGSGGREASLARLVSFLVQERVVVYQAQGMLAEQLGISTAAAAAVLKRYARAAAIPAGLVASELVNGQLPARLLMAGE